MNESIETKEFVHSTKRCPECFEYVSLKTSICPSCKTRLGAVQPHGMAKRLVNWKAYFYAFVACAALGAYVYWAFFYYSR
jgi:hypothetical protein